MTASVSYTVTGQIGNIVIDSPPVNALSRAVRQGIIECLKVAEADDTEVVVLRCEGRTFIAGADITEFGKPPQAPALATVLEALESHPKPVVAAIHGTALGGGLELALCCDYRLAAATAKVGLPEVNLGLLPGAGGTQRLPRLTGLKMAIDMITSGRPLSAGDAQAAGIVDEVSDDDLQQAALDFAGELLSRGAGKRLTRDIPFQLNDDDTALLSGARDTIAKRLKGQTAPQRILDCLSAAGTVPFEDGLKVERQAFEACMADPQSSALRHQFFAERAAAKIQGMTPDTEAQAVKHVGIIGAGTMGGGIAMCFAQAGFQVTLVDQDQEGIDRGLGTIRKNYDISVQRGRLSSDQVTGYLANLEATTDWQALQGADLIIEAVYENLELKQQVFQRLDEICDAHTILASNTSYQSIDALAAVTNRPERVVGMHFFSPANVMRLLEVVRGGASDDTTLTTAMAVGKQIGKVCVLSGCATDLSAIGCSGTTAAKRRCASWRAPPRLKSIRQWSNGVWRWGLWRSATSQASTSVIGLASNYLMKKKDRASTTCSLIAWSKPVDWVKNRARGTTAMTRKPAPDRRTLSWQTSLKPRGLSWASRRGR